MSRSTSRRPRPDAVAAVTRNWDRRAAAYHRYYQQYPPAARDAWRGLLRSAIADLLSPLSGEDRPLRVLDVGSGTGFAAMLLAELGHQVTAVEASEQMLSRARAEAAARGVTVRWHHGDAHRPPGSGYDLVTARYVLWTLPAPDAALRAWEGVLRPGGGLLVADARWHSLRQLLRSPRLFPGMLRDYLAMGWSLPHFGGIDADQTTALMTAAGFEAPRTYDQLLGSERRPYGNDVFVLGAVRGPATRTLPGHSER